MPRAFVAGCGFVGLAVARLLHRAGWDVIGATHSPASAEALADEPFSVVAADISDRASIDCLGLSEIDSVIHCASSGRGGAEQYGRVYLDGMRHLAAAFSAAHLIFTSSTSVYAQVDGSVVTEASPAHPDRETGRVLLEAENVTLARGGAVARLAGIYGPERSVLLKKFFAGEAVLEGDGSRFINQIHRDDAAAAIALLAMRKERGIFNVADDAPLSQLEVYSWLANHFARALPPYGPIDPNRKRGWTHKQVSNAKLRALGWAPRFPSFHDAVRDDAELLRGIVERR